MPKFVSLDKKTIVNVFFPTDGGRWTDQIIYSYTQQLTMVIPSLTFVNISWTKSSDLNVFLEKIVAAKPDIVFLPDDIMYFELAPHIQKVTNSQIVFATFYSDKKALASVIKNPIGVVAEAPVSILLKHARLLSGNIDSIGIIGGPYAEKMIAHLKGKLGDIKVESFQTASWFEYGKTFKAFSEKYDVVWPLPPFGIKNADDTPIHNNQFNALLEEIPKICLGYGKISGYGSTINMDVDPVILGKNAASLTFAHLKGEQVGISDFTSYALEIHEAQIKRLNLKIPEVLQGFISLR